MADCGFGASECRKSDRFEFYNPKEDKKARGARGVTAAKAAKEYSMKRLLSILLAIGISGLAFAKEERRPEPRAQKSKSGQRSARGPKGLFLNNSWYSKATIPGPCDLPTKCIDDRYRCKPPEGCEDPPK